MRSESDGDDAGSSGGLLEYWRILRRHRAAIVLSVVGGLALGIAVGIPLKPVFRARTSLEILNLNQDFMNMKQANPVNTNDNSLDVSEEQTQAKLLESSALMMRVMNHLDPNYEKDLAKSRMATSGWRSWLHLKAPVEETDREKLLDKLSTSLRIRPTAHTRVLEVTADSTDPKLTVDFVNTLVEEFVGQNMEARLNNTARTSEWLQREIGDAKAKLRQAEDDLQHYAGQSGLIFADENTIIATERLRQLQLQLSTASADRIAKEAHYELAKSSPPDSLGDVLNDNGIRETAARISELRRQIASLGAVFNPGYSKLQQAQAELAVLDTTFQHERADILKHVEDDYEEAAGREKMLAAAYDSQTGVVTGQGEKLIQYNILKREAESSRLLYDTMLQQTKQASIATAMRASNVRVVDAALLSDLPVFPDFRINGGLGMFVGLMFGIAFATVRERSDRTLRQPGDLKQWADLAELGTIPAASVARVYDGGTIQSRWSRRRNAVSDFALTTSIQQAGIAAEAFRSTLTSILFVGDNGTCPQVLVFTSPSPGDGKTSVVSNIAIAAAEIRRNVLLIDADLRRPRLHDIYKVPNDRGLSDMLREEMSDENLASFIHETGVPGLHVLPAGPPTRAAAHLLYSPNFEAMVERLRTGYDMILIDAPPVLQLTDARVAGRQADGVVLVGRAGRTTRDALTATRDRFQEDRIRVLGAVLNDWNPGKSLGGYYGYNGGLKAYRHALKAG
jgi:capsular exopolysaccharide synthesis family protein